MRPKRNKEIEVRKEFSLLELTSSVKRAINQAFTDTYWLRAEMSDVRVNASSGHCYLEFIEKSVSNGQIIARARGAIWAKIFRMLKPYFEMETGQSFSSGLKVLVKVTVEFHELYGFSLSVLDIDPAYTLGDIMQRRMEIIRQLHEEGVLTLNKELPFPHLPVRIAIITSPTAAGYEDFLNQLHQNSRGYNFYTKLFSAVMQGEKTEESVIYALERINENIDSFDIVVIIRGGGATSDLNCFDTYLLAANCAQFPLPIITGIGHERDDTVLDMVANTRMKTPTAVAEFLIGRMDNAAMELDQLQSELIELTLDLLNREKQNLQLIGTRLPVILFDQMEKHQRLIQFLGQKFPVASVHLINKNKQELQEVQNSLRQSSIKTLTNFIQFLELTEQYIKMISPEYILKRGYSLTMKGGRIVKTANQLKLGDEILTHFVDGDIQSKVMK